MLLFLGIHADIAREKYEYWASLAPLPVEIVLAAGQKSREENLAGILIVGLHLDNLSFIYLIL